MLRIRRATEADAEALAALLADYLSEGYPGHTGSSAAALRRDVLSDSPRQDVLLAENAAAVIGFIAANPVYDMHWAVAGAQIADLYVQPKQRGVGVALALLAQLAADVRDQGGAFLRGGAYERESTRRFYGRIAIVAPSGDTHLSGRAFRHLADSAGLPIRDIVNRFPRPEWNLER